MDKHDNLRLFAWFLAAYALVIFLLAGTGAEKFENLHLIFDASNGILSLLLALFLLAEQHHIEPNIRKYLAIGFGFAAATEILHALVAVEWSGAMAWVATYSNTLRPATWPPSVYVLPFSLAWVAWLNWRKAELRPAFFAVGMALLALALYALSLSLPKYMDTGILGIQRPTQAPLLFLLLGVMGVYWRLRRWHPLFEGIALMCVLLFLSDMIMLYSTSPHEKFTMMAHAGKFLAYALLHVILMRVAAGDSQARCRAESLLRESELRFRNLVETSSDWVWEVDARGVYTYASPRIRNLLGYAPDEIVGRTPFDLMPEAEAQRVGALFAEIARGHSPIVNLENANLHKDGRIVILETSGMPILGPNGELRGYRGMDRDITQREQIATALRESEERLREHRDNLEAKVVERTAELTAARIEAERLTRVKSEFLANMSHEIRTPLNAVLGFARIGVRDGAGSPAAASFQRIADAGQHLLGVINNILDFSRFDAGKFSIETHAFSLKAVITDTFRFLEEQARQKGLRYEMSVDPRLHEWVDGDAQRLQQILLNILGNAIKFTQQGEVRLRVEARDGLICFEVADTGIGMTPEQLDRLFNPFEQADNSTTRKFGGSGLGLVISHSLASLMGGAISVDSAPGKGSRFTLCLPLPQAEADLTEQPEVLADQSFRRLAGWRLLAAEDVAVNRLILEDLLTHEGAQVVFAENGQQALDRLIEAGEGAFDAVLMDIQMPVMDGFEATRRLRGIAPALPVIGLTAHALEEERDKCLTAGMVAHVTKPIDVDLLVAAILASRNRQS